jgi:hypothetical protein
MQVYSWLMDESVMTPEHCVLSLVLHLFLAETTLLGQH